MIRIAIVEDEVEYQNQLMDYLSRFAEESGEVIDALTFSDGDEIVSSYSAQFDIILMDVQMSFMDGMAAAEAIREIDKEVVIIFITNMAQFAIKGYAVDALDYVLKPVSYFAFSQRLYRAIERMKNREANYITINVKGGVQRLKISDIYFIECQGHKLIFFTKYGGIETYGVMKDTEMQLTGMHFCRSNRGYLINLEHVEGVQDGYALVKGQELAISRAKKFTFMESLTKYWGETIK